MNFQGWNMQEVVDSAWGLWGVRYLWPSGKELKADENDQDKKDIIRWRKNRPNIKRIPAQEKGNKLMAFGRCHSFLVMFIVSYLAYNCSCSKRNNM